MLPRTARLSGLAMSSYWLRFRLRLTDWTPFTGMCFYFLAISSMRPSAEVFLASSSRESFNPSPNLIDYAMVKAALVVFTQALATEVGPSQSPQEPSPHEWP